MSEPIQEAVLIERGLYEQVVEVLEYYSKTAIGARAFNVLAQLEAQGKMDGLTPSPLTRYEANIRNGIYNGMAVSAEGGWVPFEAAEELRATIERQAQEIARLEAHIEMMNAGF